MTDSRATLTGSLGVDAPHVDAEARRPAGFWIRALAALIDLVVFLLVKTSFDVIGARVAGTAEEPGAFVPLVWLFTLVFTGVYTTALHAWRGQTIGKAVVGVQVVSTDGAPVGVGAALLRWLAYLLSLLPVGLGFVMAGLRRDKRALHDLVAGTRAERLRRKRSHPEARRSIDDRLLGSSAEAEADRAHSERGIEPTPLIDPTHVADPRAVRPPTGAGDMPPRVV